MLNVIPVETNTKYLVDPAIIGYSYGIRRQNSSWPELKNNFVITNETFRLGIDGRPIFQIARTMNGVIRGKGYLGHDCNRNETISPRVGRKIHRCHGTSGTHVQSSFQRHVATCGESCRNVENWPMTIIARNFRTAYGSTAYSLKRKPFHAGLINARLSIETKTRVLIRRMRRIIFSLFELGC